MPSSTLLAPGPRPAAAVRPDAVVPADALVRGPARAAWVDIAKGLSITLVVVHHVVLLLAAQHGAPAGLVELSRTLGTVRMPVFFLASGLFAGAALAGPWSRLVHRRVALFVWLYVLWSLVRYVVFGLLAHGVDVASWSSPAVLLPQLWLPSSALWFVFALALFSVAAKALRPVPGLVRLALATGLAVVVGGGLVSVDSYAWRSMGAYFVFFLLGVDASAPIRRWAARQRRSAAVGTALGLGAAWVAVTVLVRVLDLALVPGVRWGTSLVGVGAGVALSVALAHGRAGALPAWLGTRTLDVYLVHGPVVGVVALLLAATVPDTVGWAGAVALLVGVTTAAIGLSLAAGRGLRATGAGWLFALPERWAAPPRTAAAAPLAAPPIAR
ncbi:MAG TPA: acyltransferase family protein [Actinotalea sp.]|nr:acyltransferase family protein [Actinotalea sp.]